MLVIHSFSSLLCQRDCIIEFKVMPSIAKLLMLLLPFSMAAAVLLFFQSSVIVRFAIAIARNINKKQVNCHTPNNNDDDGSACMSKCCPYPNTQKKNSCEAHCAAAMIKLQVQCFSVVS